MKRYLLGICALIVILESCGPAPVVSEPEITTATEPTTLIIVRHAEKNNETDTTTLTTAGYERAERLAFMLENTPVDAIYTTPFVRMKLTAEPTALQKDLSMQDYQPNDLAEIDRILKANPAKTVLIIGHGNAIPEIVNHYCGSSLPEKLEGYSDFFLLTITNPASATNSYQHLQY